MSVLAYIIVFSLIGSVVSLLGGVALLVKEGFARKISHLLASYAAGALLGTAFLDLLPEAIREGGGEGVFVWGLIGLLLFFLLERFIRWFHHHHEHAVDSKKPVVQLVMAGDSIHNFIDGVAMAATFMVSVPLGIVTTLAVAAHEIPQEIGDFGLMLKFGLPRRKVLFLNFVSAMAAVFGAVMTYIAGDVIKNLLPVVLAVTAGFFIYIAASDLIPEIHEENRKGFALIESMLMVLGVLTIWFSIMLLGH